MLDFKNTEHIDLIIDAAKDLDSLYPQRTLVSVGNTTSWVVYCVEQIRLLRGENSNCHFVPYSGKYFTRSSPREESCSGGLKIFTKNRSHDAERQRSISNYFNFLKLQNFDSIFNSLDSDGRKPVLSDCFFSGQGITSFLDTVSDFINNPVQDTFDMYVYARSMRGKFTILARNNDGSPLFTMNAVANESTKPGIVDILAGTKAITRDNAMSLDTESDLARFVPFYDPFKQDCPRTVSDQNKQYIQLAQSAIAARL